ncbi:amylo-alpha-1,6-glucosidase [Paenibacillus roseipurpureus]|uniref:Trehalase family glycosidase n=1 Tax=Paenibacillus roseopurpureus TaxID=2918901 RepID=A0AA96RNC4_9BACL|nr:trehalase family glycosidase [Paenibacillus sp. MBLB1832]WNR45292.1 trehalase family glycosidase [Paenibacillus sp. MBLB1832]
MNRYVDQLIQIFGEQMDMSHKNVSFSPFYSDIGLGFRDRGLGINQLFLHYNRMTTELGLPFLQLEADGEEKVAQRSLLGVSQCQGEATVRIAFYEHNAWMVEAAGLKRLRFELCDSIFRELRVFEENRIVTFDAYLPTIERLKRDPDEWYPFSLGLYAVIGGLAPTIDENGIVSVEVLPDDAGRIVLAFAEQHLEIDRARLRETLLQAPDQASQAEVLTRKWLEEALGGFQIHTEEEWERGVLAKAVYALLFNAAKPPGLFAGRVASFPARGDYPTHYLWDSCFQNLALEQMEPRLAKDALHLLIDNMRVDGKQPHFLCSTWIKPHHSQPPLVGWAGLRLVQERGDLVLAAKLLPALLRNTRWWLTQRMTRKGLIAALGGGETGWDNTPRFDHGPIIACDMNAYLLMQMRCSVELARLLGDEATALAAEEQADGYASVIRRVLYDEDANLFRDIRLETGEPLSVLTPASFLPLLVDVGLEEGKVRAMIERYLLNPNHFYGKYPFPSVAYDDPCYTPDNHWRGPIWLPIAYFMLEILRKYGYLQEAAEASDRLYRMIITDGDIRENFNSQTGEGLRSYQQGWTAAILLKLHAEREQLMV